MLRMENRKDRSNVNKLLKWETRYKAPGVCVPLSYSRNPPLFIIKIIS